MFRERKGITLVALVITIIVLLILAGVSISLVVGENGIMGKAGRAADETAKADAKSALDLALDACQAEYFDDKYIGSAADLKDVEEYFKASVISGQTNGYTVTFKSATREAGAVETETPKDIVVGTNTVTIQKTTGNSTSYSATITLKSNGVISASELTESE